jgi:hypothetical protein
MINSQTGGFSKNQEKYMASRSPFLLVSLSPFTWLALIVCVFFVTVFNLWFEPSLAVSTCSVILAFAVFMIWPFFYTRTDSYIKAAFGLDEQDKETDDDRISKLIQDFKGLGFSVENLHDVAISLRSISTIDPRALGLKLDELKKGKDFSVPGAISAIEDRRRLYEEQRQQIAKLLGQTEAAMTTLDLAAAALARTRISRGLAETGIEDAMKDLEELAARTGKYAADA